MAPRLVVIVGPTGAGKTRLSLALAEATGGEVISCDSQQVYLGMDIGTGKATPAERARVTHHLLDVVEPDQEMTAARFVELADRAIADVAARGKPAIVCGGTGLYVRALLLGLFEGPPASPELRAELATLDVAALRAELERVDPAAAARIDRRDAKRMIRALEVFRLTGEPMSAHQARHDHRTLPRRYEARWSGSHLERDALYQAIDARVDEMLEAGLERRGRGPARARVCASDALAAGDRLCRAPRGSRRRGRPIAGDRADQKKFTALRPPAAVVVPARHDDHLVPRPERR